MAEDTAHTNADTTTNHDTNDTGTLDATSPGADPTTGTDAEAVAEVAATTAAETPAEADLAKKEVLLDQARQVAAAKDWRNGSADLRRIFEEWRRIPYRRTAREDELWADLTSARQSYYDARDAARKAVADAKAALVREAEGLSESTDWRQAGERFGTLMDEWKAAGSAGHEEDERLWGEFNGFRRIFFDRRTAHYRELDQEHARNREAKEALIAQARETVRTSDDWGAREWKAANSRMRDLMAEWRKVGRARKEDNDRLWEEFNGLRQQFFDAQHAHHEEVERGYEANAAAKQELIDTARRIAGEGDYSRQAADAMRELDVRWKAVGFAGHERNDALWQEFRDAKEGFWDARRERNEERHQAWLDKTRAAAERRRQQLSNLEGQIERIQSRIDHATVTTSESQLREMQGWIDEKRERISQVRSELEDIESKLGKDA